MAKRISKGRANIEVTSIAEKFLKDPTDSTVHLLEKFPEGLINDFSRKSHMNMVSAVNTFLL